MKDYYVTVCSECRTASCWHGEYMCNLARQANVEDVPVSVLAQEAREHADNYSRQTILAVTGREPREVTP